MTTENKKIKKFFGLPAAGGLISLCGSVKNPWLKVFLSYPPQAE
jgi:hypothetical protein